MASNSLEALHPDAHTIPKAARSRKPSSLPNTNPYTCKHGNSQPANSTRKNAPATMKKLHFCMVRYGIANPCTHTWTNTHNAAKHIQDPRGPHVGQNLRDYGDEWLEVVGTLLGPVGAFGAAFDVDGQVVDCFPQMQIPATILAQMQPRLDGGLPSLPVYRLKD